MDDADEDLHMDLDDDAANSASGMKPYLFIPTNYMT